MRAFGGDLPGDGQLACGLGERVGPTQVLTIEQIGTDVEVAV